VTKVPYKTLPSETEWNLCFGLFHSNRDDEGFMVPEFSRVQVKSSLSRGLPRIGKWLGLEIGLRLGGCRAASRSVRKAAAKATPVPDRRGPRRHSPYPRCNQGITNKTLTKTSVSMAPASLKQALGRFAHQIAIPKTVKDFHQTCGYFCGKPGPMDVD
jgi:hypothetical protein